MATSTVTRLVPAANLSPANLSAARAAFVERADAAADRAWRGADMAGLPASLVAASCFLAAHGVAAPACDGEAFFNWDLATSRQFLAGLDPASRAAEIEEGRKALFVGSKRRPAIYAAPADLKVAA